MGCPRPALRTQSVPATGRETAGENGTAIVPSCQPASSAADVSLRSFLCQVDFYLAAPDDRAGTDADSTVLAALAAGCVTVLPSRYAGTYGQAAVYCAPHEVAGTVRALHARPAELAEQSERGRAFVRRHHGHEAYAERVAVLVG